MPESRYAPNSKAQRRDTIEVEELTSSSHQLGSIFSRLVTGLSTYPSMFEYCFNFLAEPSLVFTAKGLDDALTTLKRDHLLYHECLRLLDTISIYELLDLNVTNEPQFVRRILKSVVENRVANVENSYDNSEMNRKTSRTPTIGLSRNATEEFKLTKTSDLEYILVNNLSVLALYIYAILCKETGLFLEVAEKGRVQ